MKQLPGTNLINLVILILIIVLFTSGCIDKIVDVTSQDHESSKPTPVGTAISVATKDPTITRDSPATIWFNKEVKKRNSGLPKIKTSGKILFSGLGGTFVINPDGTNKIALPGWGPAWSPDGKKIAHFKTTSVSRSSSNTIVIYKPDPIPGGYKVPVADSRSFVGGIVSVMNPNGTNDVSITKEEDLFTPYGSSLQWSPDGKKIAYTAYGGLYIANTDGTGKIKVVETTDMRVSLVWSPDGKKFAYASGNIIYIIDADTKNKIKLIEHGWSPAWSPDGKKIVFECDGSTMPELCLTTSDGTIGARLTKESGWSPAWSPDGKKIAFMSNNNSNDADYYPHRLYVMNADGTGKTELALAKNGARPIWSPNGKKIAFVVPRTGYYVINADGTNRIKLTEKLTGEEESPVWSPDGEYIAFQDGYEGKLSVISIVNVNDNAYYLLTLNEPTSGSSYIAWSPDAK